MFIEHPHSILTLSSKSISTFRSLSFSLSLSFCAPGNQKLPLSLSVRLFFQLFLLLIFRLQPYSHIHRGLTVIFPRNRATIAIDMCDYVWLCMAMSDYDYDFSSYSHCDFARTFQILTESFRHLERISLPVGRVSPGKLYGYNQWLLTIHI